MAGSDFATAEAITFGYTSGEIVNATQIGNYYSFTLTEDADFLYIECLESAPLSGSPNLYVYLFDSTETQLMSSTSGGLAGQFYLFTTDLPAGTYYIKIEEGGNNADASYKFLLQGLVGTTSLWDISSIIVADYQSSVIDPAPLHTPKVNSYEPLAMPMLWADVVQPVPVWIDGGRPGASVVNGSGTINPMVNIMGYRIGNQRHTKGGTVSVLGAGYAASVLSPTIKYQLSGTVKNEGVAMPFHVVRLYDRKTGELLDSTRSDGNGFWSFGAALNESSKYYVIAFDDFDAPVLQAVVHDYLTPVTQ